MVTRLLFTLCASLGMAQALTPVIFAPGYGGSNLYVTIEAIEDVPPACVEFNLPVGRAFMAIPASEGLAINYACYKALFFVPAPAGVTVSVVDGWEGITSSYQNVLSTFHEWGWTSGVDLFASPYDYRFMARDSLKAIGFTSSLQGLVEQAYNSSGGHRVALLAHSNGPPTLYAFLTGMTSEWRAQYVQALISLSGNYLGQMNGFGPVLYNSNEDRLDMEASWEATWMMCPWGGYSGLEGLVLATTYYNSPRETNFTFSLPDVSSLFDSAGKQEWTKHLRALWPEMDRSVPPDADTYCFYGSGIATSYSYAFAGNILEAAPVLTRTMDGDDNQDIIDNAFCQRWAPGLAAANHRFEAEEFPGVGHMQMCSNPAVMDRVRAILDSYWK